MSCRDMIFYYYLWGVSNVENSYLYQEACLAAKSRQSSLLIDFKKTQDHWYYDVFFVWCRPPTLPFQTYQGFTSQQRPILVHSIENNNNKNAVRLSFPPQQQCQSHEVFSVKRQKRKKPQAIIKEFFCKCLKAQCILQNTRQIFYLIFEMAQICLRSAKKIFF